MEAPHELDLVDVGSSGLTDRRAIHRPPLVGRSEDRVDIGAGASVVGKVIGEHVIVTRDHRHPGGEIVANFERAGLCQALAVGPERRDPSRCSGEHISEGLLIEKATHSHPRIFGAASLLLGGERTNDIECNVGSLNLM